MVARRISTFFLALAVLFLSPPGTSQTEDNTATLSEIVDAYEQFVRVTNPTEAARAKGRGVTSWPDVSPEAEAQQARRIGEFLAGLEAVPEEERASADFSILQTILSESAALHEHDPSRIPFTGDWGFHSNLLAYARRVDIRSRRDARDYIRLLKATPEHFESHIANMRRGIETGFTAYTDPLDVTIEQIAEQVVSDPKESDLYAPFLDMKGLSDVQAAAIRKDAESAVGLAVQAFAEVHKFLDEDYREHARPEPGIGSVPGGEAAYAAYVKTHTTRPDLSPIEVHEIGKSEVDRIRGEMEDIIEETGFDGSFSEFLTFLRTSPEFYAESPEDLLEKASRISKRLDAILPRYFGKLPRLPYGVEPVDPAIAPGFTTGRYSGGDAKSGTPGTYLVNTYRLDQRPLYQLPALSAHEAVPGHHLQIALAQELENVPRFRQSYYATAFGEGWGLYSEKIAGEAGIYQTPYERFGALSYEMWRACRLVADTGLHYYGWSRTEAETCFRENTALSELNIKTEVTRYIGWPGQALGYKIGEITIRELRAEAEAALGDDFDIREFHDKVLEDGSMPLGMLEEKIRTWIEEAR